MSATANASQPWLASQTETDGMGRLVSPSVKLNRDAIAGVLTDILPPTGLVLEVASGSGEHVAHFASLFPALAWQPSDSEARALASIDTWRQCAGLGNLRPALQLDAAECLWPVSRADAIVCINMVHITPWAVTLGLIAGARRTLVSGGRLFLYGPFEQAGVVMASSNARFDATLRDRDPRWGLRAVEAVLSAARKAGFTSERIVPMPSNNLSIVLNAP